MARNCRVLEGGKCEITWGYSKGVHNGIDLVGAGYTLCWEVAHSDGVVVAAKNDCNYNTYPNGSRIYGNYVKIKHDDGYYTLYGHIKYNTVQVKVGDRVKKGERLGYMGNTGYSNGGHLHWEVRNKNDVTIDPTPYLDKDLPNTPAPTPTHKWNIGDYVSIDGVYVSSDSTKELKPAINHGKITRIVENRNPYLLNDGGIGWVNDECITGRYDESSLLLLVKKTINGDFGNGEERKRRLGGRYQEVQRQVNLNYEHGTTAWNKVRIY